MAVRIIAIRKSDGNHYDPHEAISHYKWLNEQSGESAISSLPTMVDWILNKNGRAYVSSQEGTVYCEVKKSPSGTLFLQTTTDSRSSNNLLNLPEC